MKKIVLFAMALVASATTHAQETVETTISSDVVSSYIWRGQDLGSAAIQPTLGVGYKGLSLSAWGSYGIADPADTKEFDLTLGYSIGGFNIGVTDYWFDGGVSTPTGDTSSMTPTAPTTSSKPTLATTSALPACSGSPTLPAMTAPTRTASGAYSSYC